MEPQLQQEEIQVVLLLGEKKVWPSRSKNVQGRGVYRRTSQIHCLRWQGVIKTSKKAPWSEWKFLCETPRNLTMWEVRFPTELRMTPNIMFFRCCMEVEGSYGALLLCQDETMQTIPFCFKETCCPSRLTEIRWVHPPCHPIHWGNEHTSETLWLAGPQSCFVSEHTCSAFVQDSAWPCQKLHSLTVHQTPIRNLLVFFPPIDFRHTSFPVRWQLSECCGNAKSSARMRLFWIIKPCSSDRGSEIPGTFDSFTSCSQKAICVMKLSSNKTVKIAKLSICSHCNFYQSKYVGFRAVLTE